MSIYSVNLYYVHIYVTAIREKSELEFERQKGRVHGRIRRKEKGREKLCNYITIFKMK